MRVTISEGRTDACVRKMRPIIASNAGAMKKIGANALTCLAGILTTSPTDGKLRTATIRTDQGRVIAMQEQTRGSTGTVPFSSTVGVKAWSAYPLSTIAPNVPLVESPRKGHQSFKGCDVGRHHQRRLHHQPLNRKSTSMKASGGKNVTSQGGALTAFLGHKSAAYSAYVVWSKPKRITFGS